MGTGLKAGVNEKPRCPRIRNSFPRTGTNTKLATATSRRKRTEIVGLGLCRPQIRLIKEKIPARPLVIIKHLLRLDPGTRSIHEEFVASGGAAAFSMRRQCVPT